METSPLLPRQKRNDDKQVNHTIIHESLHIETVSTWTDFCDLSNMAFQVSLAALARVLLTSVDAAFLGHLGVQELAAASLAQIWTTAPLMAVWAASSALITVSNKISLFM
jgi:Na+-driven multidrug efflux pump